MSHLRPPKRSIPTSDDEVHCHFSHNKSSVWPPTVRPHSTYSTSPYSDSHHSIHEWPPTISTSPFLPPQWPRTLPSGTDNCSEREVSVTSVTPTFSALESLNREIERLQAQMISIQKAIEELTALYSPLKCSIDSIFDKLSNLSPTPSPIKSNTKDLLRKRQVFLRNFAHSGDDSESLDELCEEINAPSPPTNFFRLKGEGGIRPLILTFPSSHHALAFLRSLSLRKKEGQFISLIARPNYTREEEVIYKSKWATVCAKNDEVGMRVYVVRDLEIVRLNNPGEWKRIERQIQ